MEKIYTNFAGMDLDTSPEKFNPNYYRSASNVRIGSNVGVNGSSSSDNPKGSIEGIKNVAGMLTNLFSDVTTKIISLIKLRENLVFITSSGTIQAIYNLPEANIGSASAGTLTPFFSWNKSELTLNENTTTILGRYETDKLIKVYITDGDTYLKSINLAATAPTSVKELEVFKPVDMQSSPVFGIVDGGSLKAGNIAYGIQYYSLNGSASNYIPVGPLQPVLKGNINDSKVLTGGALNEVTDKAANITIPAVGSDSGLNYAKVVRIHYTQFGEVPTITVVYDGAISNSVDTVITDSGQFIESVTPEEYAFITNPFKCKSIEQKNNILFAGNILQSEFDVDYDARIRRYAYVNADTIIPYSGDYNTYNDPNATTFLPITKFAYQSNGSTYGGTGTNGSYYFERTRPNVFDRVNKKPINNDNIYKRVFQRGEIYGFALVGFDEYMRPSFAKFIDDIKIPGYDEAYNTRTGSVLPINENNVTNYTEHNGLYPIFEFNNLPSSVKYAAVVRTVRTGDEGTIADMCILNPLWDRENAYFNCPQDNITPSLTNHNESFTDYFELISPKILVNKSLPNFDKIDYFYASESGGIKTGNIVRDYNKQDSDAEDQYYTEVYNILNGAGNIGTTTTADKKYYSYSTNKDALFAVGAEAIKSITNIRGTTFTGFKSGVGVIQTSTPITSKGTNDTGVAPMFGILKRTTYPYGGYTQSAIEQRTWMLSSRITKVSGGSVLLNTLGFGDVYMQVAPYTRIMWDVVRANFDKDVGNTAYIPFDSEILMKGVAGKTWDNYFSKDDNIINSNYRLIQESQGVWTDDEGPTTFTQDNSIYNYNSAYSSENTSKVYVTKPAVYNPQSVFDCLVKNSERKINGELIDSWTIFKPSNRIEVDTSRGELTGLVNLNNTLFFIQKAGAGTLSVDERELINSSNTGSLQLGTGGILARFDYIFTNYGGTVYTNTNNFIYFYDASAGKLCRMNTQEANILSDSLNCKSYFSSILYNKSITEFVLGADNIRQEVYFKPLNYSGIVYNELWGNFTSTSTIPFNNIFTTEDVMYFTIPVNTSFSPLPGNGGFLYGLLPYPNPDVTSPNSDSLEHWLNKSITLVASTQLPSRLDVIEWTSKNYTSLSNTDIYEELRIYEEDISFKTFTNKSTGSNPRYFEKKRYNQIYNVNTRQRCKGNYFKITYIGNNDKTKKSNFTLNSFNLYVTPLLNR